MKIALYIEDGLEQIVLTPESETEKGILGKIHDGSRDLLIENGSFYGCRGGWVRWKRTYPTLHGMPEEVRDDESTIIVLRPKKEQPAVAPVHEQMPHAPRWRHKKRGTTCTEIGRGHLQTCGALVDGQEMVIYRADVDGSLWTRPADEFEDGRFDRLSVPPSPESSS